MIDLRSDTLTRPCARMRAAMAEAAVGDDVYGEDPSVNQLEAYAASLAGFAAAVFVPTGTQSNLIALMSHCQRGDEYLVGADAHTYKYEGGGAAVLGSIQPQPLPHDAHGGIPLDLAAAAIKADDSHFARTRLLALENTQHGRVLPLSYLAQARTFATQHNLALHLDGARVFNAAVACGCPLQTITQHFDSVSICLSKGLGAPIGSVLVGDQAFIARARRWRKVTGGGWRQAGILAAAARIALEDGPDGLARDHRNAQRLAEGLQGLPGLSLEPPVTNMLWCTLEPQRMHGLTEAAAAAGITLSASRARLRLVTHRDIHDDDIDHVIAFFRQFLQHS